MVKLLHIGLGKCGSSFLQREIYPKIEKRINTNYISNFKNNFYKNDFFNIDLTKINYCAFQNYKNMVKYFYLNYQKNPLYLLLLLYHYSKKHLFLYHLCLG